jgi:hypothetical protein
MCRCCTDRSPIDEVDTDYSLTDFGGTTTTLVENPADGSNQVASTVKPIGAQDSAGTTMNEEPGGLATAIAFSATGTRMSMRCWSPDAGIPIRLKVEGQFNETNTCETEAFTTVANRWETLARDFANQAAGTAAREVADTFVRASRFFNFGTTGDTAGEKTYYWDDVVFVGE